MTVCVVSLDYLSVADMANPDLIDVVVGPGLVSTSPAFMRSYVV